MAKKRRRNRHFFRIGSNRSPKQKYSTISELRYQLGFGFQDLDRWTNATCGFCHRKGRFCQRVSLRHLRVLPQKRPCLCRIAVGQTDRTVNLYSRLVGLCITPPSFKKHVMEPNVFLGKLIKGITNVLCNFEDEQYPSNNVDPWCFQCNTMRVLHSFQVLVGLCNTPPNFKRYVMELNVLMGYLTKDIASVLNSFGHE